MNDYSFELYSDSEKFTSLAFLPVSENVNEPTRFQDIGQVKELLKALSDGFIKDKLEMHFFHVELDQAQIKVLFEQKLSNLFFFHFCLIEITPNN